MKMKMDYTNRNEPVYVKKEQQLLGASTQTSTEKSDSKDLDSSE
jgi:hypothetical protein